MSRQTEALRYEHGQLLVMWWSPADETANVTAGPRDHTTCCTNSHTFSLKAAPRGHPDCLTGKAFVISGVLDSLQRDEAEDFIRCFPTIHLFYYFDIDLCMSFL